MHEDGYTSSEIAETVHKPEGTVRSICSRIKKAIRAAYENVMNSREHGTSVTERPALSRCTELAEVVGEASRGVVPCVTNDAPADTTRRRGLETAPAEIDVAASAEECDVNSASVRAREHGSRAESRDAPLPVLTHVTPAVTIIRTLLSYFGAVYKRTAAA